MTAAPARAQAKARAPAPVVQFWLRANIDAARDAARQLLARPVGTLLTVLVIGLSLALPAALYVGQRSLEQAVRPLSAAANISVFLRAGVARADIEILRDQWLALPAVADVQFIARETAMAELARDTELGSALALLDDNPLPDVLVLIPKATVIEDPAALDQLRAHIAAQPQVERAQLDTEWIRRLAAIMAVVRQTVYLLAGAIAFGIALIVGNTIRLIIGQRHDEIVIAKLFGATDSFVRRPFLYSGFWYGLAGGVLAWLLVSVGVLLLQPGIARLAGAYGSALALRGPGLLESCGLGLAGIVLGLAGAALAVQLYLREAEPGA